jgi:hypothetical protein
VRNATAWHPTRYGRVKVAAGGKGGKDARAKGSKTAIASGDIEDRKSGDTGDRAASDTNADASADMDVDFDGELSDPEEDPDAADADSARAWSGSGSGTGKPSRAGRESSSAFGPLHVLPLYSALSTKEQQKVTIGAALPSRCFSVCF